MNPADGPVGAAANDVALAGIGVHVPRYRLDGEDVDAFWNSSRNKGESRAVANWDEDVVTMSVEAGLRAMESMASTLDKDGPGPPEISTVIVASTTLPYAEKQAAALVAEALDLPNRVVTLDVSSSLRAGTQALQLAADRVRATGERVLVVAADMRPTRPQDAFELTVGDAAVAFILSPEGPVRVRWIRGGYETWLSHWRLTGQSYGHDADSRFVSERSVASLREAFESVLKVAADEGSTLQSVAVASPHGRDAIRAAAVLPGATSVVGPNLQSAVGYTGTAAAFLALAAALEQAAGGDILAWVSLGDGADSALVSVAAEIKGFNVARAVEAARPLGYAEYLRLRGALPHDDPAPFSSEIGQWRDVAQTARLHAAQCRICGTVAYPAQPTCWNCQQRDAQDPFPLSRSGTIYTFTIEHLFPNSEGQQAMAVVELDDNVRFFAPVTDVPTQELRIGMRVRLVYRRLHLGGGFINYFWKVTRE